MTVSCLEDASIVRTAIKQQQRKLREEMNSIVRQKATQSRYPSMSRADRRVTEFHHDRLTQEQALQKDCLKAERIANRIAQVLERLRKDFNKVKNHLGSYTFANTVGQDSEASGDTTKDQSADLSTRQAWKAELEKQLAMAMHYSNSQHLGDFALSYQPEGGRQIYRPEFYYYTPSGDCLTITADAGPHSGDSTTVQSGNYNRVETRGCVVSYKQLTVMNEQEEAKKGSSSQKHLKVTNTDHELRALFRLLAASATGHRDAWWSFLVGNTIHAMAAKAFVNVTDAATAATNVATSADNLKKYFDETICLPKLMSELLSAEVCDTEATPKQYQTIYQILIIVANRAQHDLQNDKTTLTSAPTAQSPDTYPVYNPSSDKYFSIAVSAEGGTRASGFFDMAMLHAPTIANVEDEADLSFIMKLMCCVMENIRSDQILNDREISIIDYTKEVAECNEAFHQDVFSDMTAIDESELGQRYKVGKELCVDLNDLYKENCCNKQNFFNDVTLSGGLW
jgi:hypothetical protein